MIVKVQIPIVTNDPSIPALIYDETRDKCYRMIPTGDLPEEVRAVVKDHGGKAYFTMIEHEDLLLFGKEAPWQEW
jgi:hypothetical protein